jgi:hypothetical protein
MTGQLNQKRPMFLLSVWSCLPPAAANRGCWSHQTGFAAAGSKQEMRAEETFGKSLVLAGQSTLHRRGVGGGGFTATSVVSMTSSQNLNSKWRCRTTLAHLHKEAHVYSCPDPSRLLHYFLMAGVRHRRIQLFGGILLVPGGEALHRQNLKSAVPDPIRPAP